MTAIVLYNESSDLHVTLASLGKKKINPQLLDDIIEDFSSKEGTSFYLRQVYSDQFWSGSWSKNCNSYFVGVENAVGIALSKIELSEKLISIFEQNNIKADNSRTLPWDDIIYRKDYYLEDISEKSTIDSLKKRGVTPSHINCNGDISKIHNAIDNNSEFSIRIMYYGKILNKV